MRQINCVSLQGFCFRKSVRFIASDIETKKRFDNRIIKSQRSHKLCFEFIVHAASFRTVITCINYYHVFFREYVFESNKSLIENSR